MSSTESAAAMNSRLRITARGMSAPGPAPALDEDEGHEGGHAYAQQRDDARVAPAPVGRLVERHEQRHQACAQRGHAGVVDALVPGLVADVVDLPVGHR